MAELPKNSRRLLDLRYVDELSAAQVAQTIGSTGGSLRVRADSTGRGGRVDFPPPLGTGEFTLAVFVYLGTPSHEGTVATNIRGDEGNFALSLDELVLFDKALNDKDIADLYQAAQEETARSQ